MDDLERKQISTSGWFREKLIGAHTFNNFAIKCQEECSIYGWYNELLHKHLKNSTTKEMIQKNGTSRNIILLDFWNRIELLYFKQKNTIGTSILKEKKWMLKAPSWQWFPFWFHGTVYQEACAKNGQMVPCREDQWATDITTESLSIYHIWFI